MARHQPLFSSPRSLVMASVLGLGILLGGCQTKILQHGNVPDEDEVVQIMPGRDGLVHISQIANERIANVGDYLKEGQQVRVKVLETDERGRIRLSIKAVLNEETAAAAPAPSEAAAQ